MLNQHIQKLLILILLSSLTILQSCGSSSSSNETAPEAGQTQFLTSTNFIGTLFGTFNEDADSPDPTGGRISISLNGDGTFSGSMVFSFLGCQQFISSGVVTGNKFDENISATWEATVDGFSVGGELFGSCNNQACSGMFTSDNAREFIEVGDCSYYVSAGTWETSLSQ